MPNVDTYQVFEHPYLSDLWFGAAPRMDINKLCLNESGLPIQNMITI